MCSSVAVTVWKMSTEASKSQEICLPLYRRMRQMDKDGKKMVAEFEI